MNINEKEIEKEVFFYNYKEPLKKYDLGFGYKGVLIYDKTREKVQCHLCGKFFRALNNGHLGKVHSTTAREYKKDIELSPTTALIGEATREKLILRNLDFGRKNLDVRLENLKSAWKKRKKSYEKISLEVRNKRGTCPDQLLDKIKKIQEILGHVPT